MRKGSLWKHTEPFTERHVGPDGREQREMLGALGLDSMETLLGQALPAAIRTDRPLALPEPPDEHGLLDGLRERVRENAVLRSYIGLGYHDCITPPVIQRNVFENPAWYTAYTPYQAEISQGRLEALLNFQTLVADLTGLPLANASLLDEGTAAAEAMHMFRAAERKGRTRFLVADGCHPQTLAVVRTRAEPIGVEVVEGPMDSLDLEGAFGALLQYPATDGALVDPRAFCERAHAAGVRVVMAADPLALCLLTPPGELGADVAIGTTQRFGVPLGYGGPHAAYMAAKQEFSRLMPGRIIGLSQDARGKPALRMALQTREQHIRREKATSNICTAQVLLAVMAGAYAVYHGPHGLERIAGRVHELTCLLAKGLEQRSRKILHRAFFDTVAVDLGAAEADAVMERARKAGMNLRRVDRDTVGVSLDETTRPSDVVALLEAFAPSAGTSGSADAAASPRGADGSDVGAFEKLAVENIRRLAEGLANGLEWSIPEALSRKSDYLTHPVFNTHHSESEMLRYLRRLESRDLSLVHSMIPLGSCTMKLNAAVEMLPLSWPELARIHPFAPTEQTRGYDGLLAEIRGQLCELTGFDAVSMQPNAGSQGEYAGLLVIRAYHRARGDLERDVCLIPASAHGTNPASAAMAGMKVVVVGCDEAGNVDLDDLRAKIETHAARLSALMVTYPSTHGVFEEQIVDICRLVHEAGGQVYMDGANMNAQVGLCRPAEIGADVCHLNLHKTFCIPHGGGGPGMGPIGVKAHLAPFLPGHPLRDVGGEQGIGAISSAPYGSPSITAISWAYIRLMGADGLRQATEVAILSANYIAHRLETHYPVLYRGREGRVAHECIVDLRALKKSAGIEVEDVAKRLMDYGFHAPTVSFPVAGTMMIEPTESEPLAELDRFCEAMIAIREEIAEVEAGRWPRDDNPLKNAPHTADVVTASEWGHPYTRAQAAFPAAWLEGAKFWPVVGRLNNVLGDRNLICTCPPVSEWAEEEPESGAA